MRASTAFITLAATAAPTVLAATAYIPYAYNSSIPAIHNQLIAANDLAFWISKPVTATCPSSDTDCPSENTTVITGPATSPFGDPGSSLNIQADGGQDLYTDIPGLLQYAAVNTSNAASTTKPSFGPFYVVYDETIGSNVLRFTNEDTGHFVACTQGDAYSIWAYAFGYWAYEDGPCYEFEMVLDETTLPAVDWYD